MFKDKNLASAFIKSTIKVISLSLLGAFSLYLIGLNFWGTFLLLICLQYILFYCISYVLNVLAIEKTKQKEIDKLEKLSTLLNCAYCNKPNVMTFDPNESSRIEFECEHCKNKNLVTMQFLVARITEPVNLPKVTGVHLEKYEE
jgi:hypothetical protein